MKVSKKQLKMIVRVDICHVLQNVHGVMNGVIARLDRWTGRQAGRQACRFCTGTGDLDTWACMAVNHCFQLPCLIRLYDSVPVCLEAGSHWPSGV